MPQSHRCAPARGLFETLEARMVLSASSLADLALASPVEEVEEVVAHCDEVVHIDHDDALEGYDAYGNEYHAIPLPDFNRVSTNSLYPSLNQPVQLEPLADTFHLHSNPGATKKIYLDFTGHTTTGTYWNSSFNGGADIVTPAYSFSGDASFTDSELQRIQYIWQRVSEDYAPFDVDITTADPGADALRKSGSGDEEWGVRVVIGGNGSWYGSAGGVAYVGSFDWGSDTPVFVFEDNLGNGNEKYTAEAISHEVGHSLGLSHDGSSSTSYYQGHGSGETGWAPIMGVGYYRNLSQWSKGEYPNANNTQDDLAIITSGNGFGYSADDHGDANGSATALATDQTAVSGAGIVEQNTDVDVFSFNTAGGNVDLTFSEAARGANLDMLVELYNSSNQLVASSNPTDELGAALNLNLSAGEYFIHISGTGMGDPLNGGYTDYGSLGQYTISGTVDGLVGQGAIAMAALEADSTGGGDVGGEAASMSALAPETSPAQPLAHQLRTDDASIDHIALYRVRTAAQPTAVRAAFASIGAERRDEGVFSAWFGERDEDELLFVDAALGEWAI